MTLSPSKTRIESASCLDLDMNPDQCADLQRCITLFGVRSVRIDLWRSENLCLEHRFENINHIFHHYNTITNKWYSQIIVIALPTTPTNVRLTDFVINGSGDGEHTGVEEKDHTVVEEKEHKKKNRDFMIHCKDAAVQMYDLDLCFSELHMKSFDNVHHVKVSNLKTQNIVSVKSLEISADTHESTRHIT